MKIAEKIIRYIEFNGVVKAFDVGELIRCKDCKWGREACGNIECLADTNDLLEYHGYDWFCPNGERKEE